MEVNLLYLFSDIMIEGFKSNTATVSSLGSVWLVTRMCDHVDAMLFLQNELLLILHFFKRFYLFLETRGWKEKERERSIGVWLPLTCPTLGAPPATQACALTGNQTGDALFAGWTSIHWATVARANFYLKWNYEIKAKW